MTWHATHCIECHGAHADYCIDCPCHHQDDEGRDCD